MPRGIMNWTFDKVVSFLEQHGFVFAYCHGGSHHYYKGVIDEKERLVQVQFHATNIIKPKSLRFDIIHKSGIPEKYWTDWAEAGNKRLQKKILYPGANIDTGDL